MFGIKIPHLKDLDHMLGSVTSHLPGGAEAQSKVQKVVKTGLSQVSGQEMIGKATSVGQGAAGGLMGHIHDVEHNAMKGLKQLTSKTGEAKQKVSGASHAVGSHAEALKKRMGVGNPSESIGKITRGKKGLSHATGAESHAKHAEHAMKGGLSSLEHGHSMLASARNKLNGLL